MVAPTQIDQWRISELLGSGGNADVWLTTDGRREVALKVLKTRRPDSEQYARFRNEIKALRLLADDSGILPILDAALPERPTKKNPAWIAMPRATPIRDAVHDADLTEVVAALANIAETLARVAVTGIAHRDVKPDNLYQYEGRWVVSDFGIAHIPDAPDLTGDRLGPFGYTPDELLSGAADADPFSVDVFQTAKTLLVLASRAAYPPQGHIPTGSSGALSRYVSHPRAVDLDELIDRCTRRDPSTRPQINQVSRDLRTWLEHPVPAQDIELADVIANFRHAHRETFNSQAQRDEWVQRFEQIGGEITETTIAWIHDRLAEGGLKPRVSSWHEHDGWVTRGRHMGSEQQLGEEQFWVTAEFGDPHWPTKIAVGLGIDLDLKGEFWCAGHVAWGDLESTGSRHVNIDERVAQIESLQVRALLDEVRGEMQEACVQMLRELAAESA